MRPSLSYARALSAAGLFIHSPPLGGGKEQHPLEAIVGGVVVFDADSAEATLYTNNIPTDIALVPEYGEDGVESWRPMTDKDSTELELQAGLLIVSNESLEAQIEKGVEELANRHGISPERVRELAQDPAHGGKISLNTLVEAEAILRVADDPDFTEFAGEPERSGLDESDFIDENGQEWDVKSYRSARGFNPDVALDKLMRQELRKDVENVLIDTSGDAVDAEPKTEGRVFFHP